ncbi:MAG: hypothetical protein HPY71_02605 [Firmicutes bacterium]|nr:hypothetical protein [Bacillota bacterium]
MSVHEELLKLIEALPESEIPVVKSFVEFVLSRTAGKDSKAFLDPVLHALETAPEDDELAKAGLEASVKLNPFSVRVGYHVPAGRLPGENNVGAYPLYLPPVSSRTLCALRNILTYL